MQVSIQTGDPKDLQVQTLIQRLDQYLTELYPSESNHLLPIDSLCQENVTFLVAKLNHTIVGCGAFVNQGTYAEIKRMFVLPEHRGLRIGSLLLTELETRARRFNLKVVRLETGISQPEAIQLYERAGYRKCLPFGDYLPDPLSIFLEKELL